MGFEQLAALRTQLAEKARQEKLAKQGGASGKGREPRPPKGPAAKSDVRPEGAKPGVAGKAGGSSKPAHAAKPPGNRPRAETNDPTRAHRGKRPDRGDRPARAAQESAAPTDPVLLLIRKLQNRYAATFPKKPAPKVPLKIGIFEDLMAHASELGADETQLRAAIKTWCGGSRYWACMIEGAQRIDLEGHAAGVVTAADANRARRLEAHREKRAQQRAPAEAGKPAGTPVEAAGAGHAAAQPDAEKAAATHSDQAMDAADAPVAPVAQPLDTTVAQTPASDADAAAISQAVSPPVNDSLADQPTPVPAIVSQSEPVANGH